MLYVEMLAHAHLDPSFVTKCADVSLRRPASKDRYNDNNNSSSSSGSGSGSRGQGTHTPVSTERIKQYLSAARQIENLICTSRESLLGSSAWPRDFLASLKSRPFYFVTDVSIVHVIGSVDINDINDISDTSHYFIIIIVIIIIIFITIIIIINIIISHLHTLQLQVTNVCRCFLLQLQHRPVVLILSLIPPGHLTI